MQLDDAPLDVIVALPRNGAAIVERIHAVAPDRLRVFDLWEDLAPQVALDWPEIDVRLPAASQRSADEVEAIVRTARVALLGYPFPKSLPASMLRLGWAHFTFAGVSNLMGSAWWGLEGVTVTSSRGVTAPRPIAESAVAAALLLARKLDVGAGRSPGAVVPARKEFAEMSLVEGKTMAIVGLGGIGTHVARLSKGLGMRVVATRRSAATRQRDVDGVDELFPAAALESMLAEADFVTVCAMWTPETEGLIGRAAFAALKPGAILVNIARGELIDEDALVAALHAGRVRGAYLDVWHGDVEGQPPSPALLAAPNLVLTPHVSGLSDVQSSFGPDLFVDNLRRLFAGEPLTNVVDWSRGY